MELHVRLFAGMAETFGASTLTVTLSDRATVRALKQQIVALYPDLADDLSRALVAVNRTYADDDVVLHPNDELGVIPPVGGGSDNSAQRLCTLSTLPLDVAEAFQLLSNPHCGGTVVFSGTVREWTKERQTSHLEYEAYSEMALTTMKRIQTEIETSFPGTVTLCWHRLGPLSPTEVAVICGAAAPHRDDAFTAARLLIDRVKREVPIWKKEYYVNGTSVWQENDEPLS